MAEIALDGADCEAYGHPTSCQEPAPGSVTVSNTTNITVTVDGVTKDIATTDDATLSFSSHAHDYSEADGCHDTQSHDISPSETSAITINGSPMLFVGSGVATDPSTGGDVDIVNTINPKITQS